MKTKFALITSVCVASLASAASAATEFSAWDTDGDNEVTLAEWNEVMDEENVFDMVDKNNNGVFDIEEAADSVFDYDMSMDLDAGGHIERQEFLLGVFNQLDRDGDEQLDEDEFAEFLGKAADSDLFN